MTQAEGYPPSTTFDNTPRKFHTWFVLWHILFLLC